MSSHDHTYSLIELARICAFYIGIANTTYVTLDVLDHLRIDAKTKPDKAWTNSVE